MAADDGVEEVAADLDLGRALGELELGVLKFADRPADGVSFRRGWRNDGESRAGTGFGWRRQTRT